jgi:hypothetical protein
MWSTGNDGESKRVGLAERRGLAKRAIRRALLACAAITLFAAAPSEVIGQAGKRVRYVVFN